MYRSPSTLKEDVRKKLSASLNARLADGLLITEFEKHAWFLRASLEG